MILINLKYKSWKLDLKKLLSVKYILKKIFLIRNIDKKLYFKILKMLLLLI